MVRETTATPACVDEVTMSATYEVRVRGRLSGLLLSEFDELDLAALAEPADTVLYGPLVDEALHGLLRRIEALGLELIEVRRSPPTPLRLSASRPLLRAAAPEPRGPAPVDPAAAVTQPG
jgi:hypothetical protein